jgi:hypothetical protein
MKKPDRSPANPVKRKMETPLGDKLKPVSITDCTEEEKGLGFVIGAGAGTGQQHGEPVSSPSAAPSRDTSKKGGARPKQK